jgi:hypothetical protein
LHIRFLPLPDKITMHIISHRGYWHSDQEKNRKVAFERSFSLGFGTETDVRDRLGQLVIAHDISKDADMSFEDFCKIYCRYSHNLPLAVNVKSDGLGAELDAVLRRYGIENYFLFDMSVPELRKTLKFGLNCYTRVSDIEREPILYGQSKGIWFDSFYSDWWKPIDLLRYLRDDKSVCLVSPELHQRDADPIWSLLKKAGMHLEPNLSICTDFPEAARSYFFDRGE